MLQANTSSPKKEVQAVAGAPAIEAQATQATQVVEDAPTTGAQELKPLLEVRDLEVAWIPCAMTRSSS